MKVTIKYFAFVSVVLIAWVIIYTGAFTQQILIGSGVNSSETPVGRLINTLLYIPLYGAGVLFLTQDAGKQITSYLLKRALPFLAFAMYSLVMCAFAYDRMPSIINSGQLLLTTIMSIGLALAFNKYGYERKLVQTFSFILFICLIYIIFFPSMGRMRGVDFTNLAGMPQGVFAHKNRYAEVASIGLILAITCGARVKIRKKVILAALSVLGLVLAESTAKAAAALVAIGAYIPWRLMRPSLTGRVGFFAFMGYVVIIAIIAASLYMGVVLEALGKDPTLTGRTEIWEHAKNMIMLRPLTGYGAASIWSTPLGEVPGMSNYRPPHSHNLILEMTLRYGLIGDLIILWCLGAVIRQIVRTDDRGFNRDLLLVFFISTLVRAPFDVVLFRDNDLSYSLLMIIFCCSCLAGYEQRRAEPRLGRGKPPGKNTPRQRRMLGALIEGDTAGNSTEMRQQ